MAAVSGTTSCSWHPIPQAASAASASAPSTHDRHYCDLLNISGAKPTMNKWQPRRRGNERDNVHRQLPKVRVQLAWEPQPQAAHQAAHRKYQYTLNNKK
jgi:hypothetical protein